MRCPIDGAVLVIAERGGIEIDHCPTCRGVWLDRGELDKIIERSADAAPTRTGRPAPVIASADDRRWHDADDEEVRRRPGDRRYVDQYGRPRKKRESFLSDLFDF